MCWDCYGNKGGDPYKVFIQGGVPPEDFDEDIKYRHPKRRSKKSRSRAPRGCMGNEHGAHIYVWTTETNSPNPFAKFYGWEKKEKLVCVGCGRSNGSRNTERYEAKKERAYRKRFGGPEEVERGTPQRRRRRWNRNSFYGYKWEMENPEYAKFYHEYTKRYMYYREWSI